MTLHTAPPTPVELPETGTSALGTLTPPGPLPPPWIEDQVTSTSSSADPALDTLSDLTTNALGPQIKTSPRPPRETASALMELRRLSGLTWDQLARLFSVSRRTMHFWASGKPLNTANEKLLWRVLDFIKTVDRGFASWNRSLLLRQENGTSVLDILARGDYETAHRIAGPGPGRPERPTGTLSPEEKALRRPLSPEILAGALQDPVHRPHGKPRGVKAGRVKKRMVKKKRKEKKKEKKDKP